MLSLKFFGLVIILVMLLMFILALWNDENGMFTDDYYEEGDEHIERF